MEIDFGQCQDRAFEFYGRDGVAAHAFWAAPSVSLVALSGGGFRDLLPDGRRILADGGKRGFSVASGAGSRGAD